jgi:hypothetical protein
MERMMRVGLLAVVMSAVCVPVAMAQGVAATAPVAAPAAVQKSVSAIMQPALSMLQETVTGLSADKWKVSGTLRDETTGNLSSIRKDLDGTLPGLLASADASGSASGLMPAYRNVEALYDVVLRVDAAARVGAPGQQAAALDQALAKLDDARREFGDRILTSAQAQEKQVGELQASLKAAQVPVAAAAPVCPTVTPAKKPAAKKPAAKPAAKPATPPTSN